MSGTISPSIIRSYREMYGMSRDPEPQRVLEHWELEKQLREDLMKCSPSDRCETAERVYSDLYTALKWHDDVSDTVGGSDNLNSWVFALPDDCQEIYEIGSGQGSLIRALAEKGYHCRGTEITSNRGEVYAGSTDGVTWGATDGVHIDQYEPTDHYDVVISNQVVEHLHPDDLATHFATVLTVLRPGGVYLVSTPNHLTGPHDVSRVFQSREAAGLHLKEYDWRSLARIAHEAGFASVEAGTLNRLRALRPSSSLLKGMVRSAAKPYLYSMFAIEGLLHLVPTHSIRSRVARALKSAKVFSDNVFIVCRASG